MKHERKTLIAALSLPLIMLLFAIWRIIKPHIDLDALELFGLILFFGFIFYYVIFRAPASDMVFSSKSEGEVEDIAAYLSLNGIRTYVKNMSEYRNIMRYPGRPSLHVIDHEERDKALELIRNRAS